MGVKDSYVSGLVCLRLGVKNFNVWYLVFLRFGVSDTFVLGLVCLRLEVKDCYVWELVILTFGG